MSNINQMYQLSFNQVRDAILLGGHEETILIQGTMGIGKSSMLPALGRKLPTHKMFYCDCTTKDLGDLTIPNLRSADDGSGYVTYVTNEELGMHLNEPIILMLDEFGKANPAVKMALTRVILERKIGSYEMHPDSIVFATTNLGVEGVGDLLAAHQLDRLTVVTMRKPNSTEWIEWGINNEIEPSVLGWAKDTPQLFASFEDVKDPEDNPYIFHPRAQRDKFVTNRGLARASNWVKKRGQVDDQTLTSLLIGTIGARGALDLMAFVKLADQLPSLDSIKQEPHAAKIPTSASAVCMVVFRALAGMDRSWIDAWMTYLERLDMEAQALFGVHAAKKDYAHQQVVMTNKKFTDWVFNNNHMFKSDV